MKERPIILTVSEVRAILEGRKAQTRRVMKPQIQQNANLGMTWPKVQGWYAAPYPGSGTGVIGSFEQPLPPGIGKRMFIVF